MLFSEVYGSYYRAVAAILQRALEAPVTQADMVRLCNQYSFGDAALNIPEALKADRWPLLTADGQAVVERVPALPLTQMELRWFSAIARDPRVQLFEADLSFLNGVEPLFTPGDVEYFDRSDNGDDYASPHYRAVFRTLLAAIRQGQRVSMTYASRRSHHYEDVTTPLRLEYSEKDDCFRVLCQTEQGVVVRNLSGVQACALAGPHEGPWLDPDKRPTRQVTLVIWNIRNALERVSLHFAHLRKEVERDGDNYRMTLWYDATDEAEMVIRVLQFGPAVRVVEPSTFREEVGRRLLQQLEMLEGAQAEQEG